MNLPWTWEEDTANSIVVLDSTGAVVAGLMPIDDGDEITPRERELAEFIVSSVNKAGGHE